MLDANQHILEKGRYEEIRYDGLKLEHEAPQAEHLALKSRLAKAEQELQEWQERLAQAERYRREMAPYFATASPTSRRLLAIVCQHAPVKLSDLADDARQDAELVDAMCRLREAGLIQFDHDQIQPTAAGRERMELFLKAA